MRCSVRFQFALSSGYQESNGSLTQVVDDFSNDVLDENTRGIDADCVGEKEHSTSIDETEKEVVLNATIYVCDEETETILATHVGGHLEADLLNVSQRSPLLIVPTQITTLRVDDISDADPAIASTMSSTGVNVETTVDVVETHEDEPEEGESTFLLELYALIGVIVLAVVVVIALACKVKKIVSAEKSTESDSVVAPTLPKTTISSHVPTVRDSDDDMYNEADILVAPTSGADEHAPIACP